MKITSYEAICNLGNSIDEIYEKAINGDITCFDNLDGYITGDYIRAGLVKADLPIIDDKNFNIRCNRLLLKNLELISDKISNLLKKYSDEEIGVVAATTNSGVNEYEISKNKKHCELGNPAEFLKQHLKLKGFDATVSTACSSGLKAFLLAGDLLKNDICSAVIVCCTDAMAKIPIYGFNSLGVLSNEPSVPFSKNCAGMNLGEAVSMFIVEKDSKDGIEIMGIGESSDIYHSTTPDPEAKEAIKAIKQALNEAQITPEEVDYINTHGTGTGANDVMETRAIYEIFSDKVPVSSTKPMTGHCLGAAAGIETALCCKLLDCFDGRLYPHVYDGEYDELLPKVNIVTKDKRFARCNICMCNSFGFGGTNAIMIMGKNYE